MGKAFTFFGNTQPYLHQTSSCLFLLKELPKFGLEARSCHQFSFSASATWWRSHKCLDLRCWGWFAYFQNQSPLLELMRHLLLQDHLLLEESTIQINSKYALWLQKIFANFMNQAKIAKDIIINSRKRK